ncbi:putative F-box domain-containing protein [Arabidopsis thaliana]
MENDKHNNPKTIFIPDDIAEGIFHHLPITSLARFKVLSKKWTSMIESTYFSHKRLIRTGLPTPNMKFFHISQHFTANFVEEYSNSITFLWRLFLEMIKTTEKLVFLLLVTTLFLVIQSTNLKIKLFKYWGLVMDWSCFGSMTISGPFT